MAFLDQHNVKVIDWPDMTPIEHVWDKMSIWIQDMDCPPSNLAKLRQAVRESVASSLGGVKGEDTGAEHRPHSAKELM